MKKLNSLLLFFGLVTAIGIAFLLRPEKMGDGSFVLVILWLSILVISNWFISTYVFTNVKSNKQSTNFGVLPSLHFVVFLYSVYSMTLLLVAYWLNDYQTLPTWHWVLQLLGFGLCTSIFVLILISSKTAEIDSTEEISTKESVLERIKFLKLHLDPSKISTINQLKELEDVIKYSTPHISVMKNTSEWNKLYLELSRLNESDLLNSEIESKFNELIRIVKSC